MLFTLVGIASSLGAHSTQAGPPQPTAEPNIATVCELAKNPSAFNHKLIQVTGFVSHGFEDFTLLDPSCPSWYAIWLEYGGTVKSGTMYCCGVTADRSRPQELEVQKIPIPLVDDEHFREFDRLIQRPPDSVVHGTIVGLFFAGPGYGHMGCCSLLAIQQVVSVDPQDREDLDYRASPDQPRADKVGCGYRDLLPIEPYADSMQAQKSAEANKEDWAFTDPERVASESLARLLKIDEASINSVKQARKAQGRFVYEWNPRGKAVSYMVVVSRPYWLSFYAEDGKKVAWTVVAAYASSCGKGNSVTRIG